MFTGIVSAVASVVAHTSRGRGTVLTIERPPAYERIAAGESIAVSGVCLTVLPGSAGPLTFDVSPETLDRSTLRSLKPGDRVNLERALLVGDRFGGHVVSGHVDATTTLLRITNLGEFSTYSFAIESGFSRYVVEKGSIALDGVSLTIARLGERDLDVALVPHTLAETTLGSLRPGARVNVEVDLIGKYVERMLGERALPGAESRDDRLRRLLSTAE
ncbi:MAG: riboflavin synthase [Thermoanaerobaculia bacterium]